jgi:predicted enzyme related to lactoylglutathione lyase
MTETLVHAPGTPSWVDLASPDLDASRKFYGDLFGWEAWVAPQPEAGGYTIFLKNGQQVAGLGPMQEGGHPAWSTYVAVADAEETAQKVREAGGQVVFGPMQVMDQGTMAVFQDPTGAFISIWQGAAMQGAQLVNAPGGFGWNELATRDMPAAKAFYAKVFGWGAKDSPMPQGGSYTEWQLDGKSIGGGMQMGDNYPPQVPPHWLVYFVVEDADLSTAKAEELGAKVIMPPMTIEPGRFSVVQDPNGAAFALFAAPK